MIGLKMKRKKNLRLFEPEIIKIATRESFVKLNPKILMKNPVMFTVEIGAVIMMVNTVISVAIAKSGQGSFIYNLLITILLLLTFLFSNFVVVIRSEVHTS